MSAKLSVGKTPLRQRETRKLYSAFALTVFTLNPRILNAHFQD